MARVLIIGYGNPLRGDDGAGWYVAERVEGLLPLGAAVEVITAHQLLPEFAEAVSGAAWVILIDASMEGVAGQVGETEIAVVGAAPRAIGHSLGPGELLACAKEWYGRAPRARLYTITGESFAHDDRLSPVVQAACDELVGRITAWVRQALREGAGDA